MGEISFFEKLLIPTHDNTKQIISGSVKFDHEKCKSCSLCVESCPADSLFRERDKPYLKPPGINECIACGDCVAICPENAITLTKSYQFFGYFKTIDQGELMEPRLFEE